MQNNKNSVYLLYINKHTKLYNMILEYSKKVPATILSFLKIKAAERRMTFGKLASKLATKVDFIKDHKNFHTKASNNAFRKSELVDLLEALNCELVILDKDSGVAYKILSQNEEKKQ